MAEEMKEKRDEFFKGFIEGLGIEMTMNPQFSSVQVAVLLGRIGEKVKQIPCTDLLAAKSPRILGRSIGTQIADELENALDVR